MDHTIRLRDGRTLGYAEYGRAEGLPLLYFHGHPGSRFEARFLSDAAERAGVRLIGLDRPGLGLSTYQPRRRITDWPNDVIELADALGMERFAIVGFSGGGPYAAACARQIPERIIACGIVCGVGHVSPWVRFLSRWVPWIMLPILSRGFLRDETRAQATITGAAKQWPEPDRQLLAQPGAIEAIAASLVEALRPGARGAAYDGTLLADDWGFRVEDITLTAIYLWHGALDNEVPIASAHALAERIPQCKATYYPDEAHMSVIFNHGSEIIASLTAVPMSGKQR